MSRTLFWYLFRDLMWIFLLASVSLAGIMSFGGLLRPLTRHGLDLWQVIQMVAYLMPAMMTYSIPIASLFATTIVYGRLTADNELTAVRAAGISHLAIAIPAMTMGLVVALGSLLFLSYVVPHYSLSVQRVIYANVAKYVANEIHRAHQFQFGRGGTTVFAQDAFIPPQQPGDVQTVVLTAPTIVNTSRSDPQDPHLHIPKTFAMARRAVLRIKEQPDEEMLMEAELDGGTVFYRQGEGRPQAGIGQTTFGPIPIPSLINENMKFMNLGRLERIAANPERSQRVRRTLAEFIAAEQEDTLLRSYLKQFEAGRPIRLAAGEETYEIRATGVTPRYREQRLHLGGRRGRILLTRQLPDGRVDLRAEAQSLDITAEAQNPIDRMIVHLELAEADLTIREDQLHKPLHVMAATIPMAKELQGLRKRTAEQYLKSNYLPARRSTLLRDFTAARNDAIAEIHGRASFAVSCLVLVVLGCGMGMTFRSADFLSAFAVCVVPAILTITLVVAGQQMANELPRDYSSKSGDPLRLALMLIWSGNILVAGLAVCVLRRLQKQ